MSILESMVSTEKRYTHDNFLALKGALVRGEYLYRVRLYAERPSFQSEKSGVLRMRMLLGFVEARAVVIDALIRTDGSVHYLSVLCSSSASPRVFSDIMKKIVPQAIIEQTQGAAAEEWVSTQSVRSLEASEIPLSGAFKSVNESRNILVSLLLEYRALLTECDAVVPNPRARGADKRLSGLSVQFLLFERDRSLCGIPDFQVSSVTAGANGAQLLQISRDIGARVIACEDLVCLKEIPIAALSFNGKFEQGYYGVSAPTSGGDLPFRLVVPSFL